MKQGYFHFANEETEFKETCLQPWECEVCGLEPGVSITSSAVRQGDALPQEEAAPLDRGN